MGLWTIDEKVLSDEERVELMDLGETIVKDVERLLKMSSSAIRTKFTHSVWLEFSGKGEGPVARSPEVLVSFVITDLGGSDEAVVKAFILKCLLKILAEKEVKRKIQWSFKVSQ
jgi:hypothetical protein